MFSLCLSPVRAEAANILWVSEITDPAGADMGFLDLLTGAGHDVTRLNPPNLPSPAEIDQFNAADLVIIGRSNASGDFQDPEEQDIWNNQVTSDVMIMSAYLVRDNRLRWMAGNDLPDSGPTPLFAEQPNHPVFDGIALNPDGTTVDDYNIMIDRGTSTNTTLPVGGDIIATNPSVMTGSTMGVAIAEWLPGATIGGDMVLSGHRMLFNAGSREASGAAIPTAGVLDLTEMGQQLFLNAVAYLAGAPPEITPGDFNSDDLVDLADFEIMLANFNLQFSISEGLTKGDMDRNGLVDLRDFGEFRTIFNSPGAQAAAVPEPATLALGILGIVLLAVVGRRLK